MIPLSCAALPATPQKRSARDVINDVVRQLNNDYGLGVTIPDPTLSPVARKQRGAEDEQFARCDRICSGIQFLYYQNVLGDALEAFFNEAKAASLRWVPKPRADPNTLPSPRAPPRAQTAGQAWGLQTILINIIEGYKAERRPALLLPRVNSIAGRSAAGSPPGFRYDSDTGSPGSIPESPASSGSKRSLDGYLDHSAKRSRNLDFVASPALSPTRTEFTDALDNVPTRRRLKFDPPAAKRQTHQQGEDVRVTSRSANTSFDSNMSSLFSARGGLPSTQTSWNNYSPQHKAPPDAPDVFDFPPLFPSPRLSSANKAVQHDPPAAGPSSSQVPKRQVTSTVQRSQQSPAVRSSYSSSPGSDLLLDDIRGQGPGSPRKRLDSFSASGKSAVVEKRLQNIWRTYTH